MVGGYGAGRPAPQGRAWARGEAMTTCGAPKSGRFKPGAVQDAAGAKRTEG